MDQNSFDLSRIFRHRLVNEVEVDFLGLPLGPTVDDHFSCGSTLRNARLINPIKEFKNSLSFEFGEGFADRLTNKIFGPLAPGQFQVVVIYEREAVLGTTQEPDCGWRLHKEVAQTTPLGLSRGSELAFHFGCFPAHFGDGKMRSHAR